MMQRRGKEQETLRDRGRDRTGRVYPEREQQLLRNQYRGSLCWIWGLAYLRPSVEFAPFVLCPATCPCADAPALRLDTAPALNSQVYRLLASDRHQDSAHYLSESLPASSFEHRLPIHLLWASRSPVPYRPLRMAPVTVSASAFAARWSGALRNFCNLQHRIVTSIGSGAAGTRSPPPCRSR